MSDKNPAFVALLKNPVHLLAFGFGSGLAPVAPGTFGTLAAVPLFCVMVQLPLLAYAGLTLVACLIGIYLCGKTATDLGVHDHGGIVWDEFAGFWLAMLPVAPIGAIDEPRFWLITAIGFAVFRFFDALKPWPIRWLDKSVHGGLGIMLDDLLAGAITLGIIQGLIHGGL